ncbi:MAG: ribosome biogenesis factor YjgA [Gammaproteobacteria bacterium]
MTEYIDEDDEWVSKTQRKRECDQLQSLGEELITLSNQELDQFNLSDSLYKAILEARKIKQHGALKRQRQYIGKLMRDIDTEDIANRLEKIRHQHDLNNVHFKRIEQWRDRILQTGDQAINDLLAEFPLADRQYLRQLHRNSIKEAKQNKPPAAARLIFKYLRELSE